MCGVKKCVYTTRKEPDGYEAIGIALTLTCVYCLYGVVYRIVDINAQKYTKRKRWKEELKKKPYDSHWFSPESSPNWSYCTYTAHQYERCNCKMCVESCAICFGFWAILDEIEVIGRTPFQRRNPKIKIPNVWWLKIINNLLCPESGCLHSFVILDSFDRRDVCRTMWTQTVIK